MDEKILTGGALDGRNAHVMTGRFSVRATGDEWTLVLDDDFTFDGAPEPWWGFGKDEEEFDRATMFAMLASDSGAQSFPIPQELDVKSFDSLILWCRAVDVLLGVGPFDA